MAAKIVQKSASEPKARPEAPREPWAHPGLMFELFQGACLLLFACCFSIAGALSNASSAPLLVL